MPVGDVYRHFGIDAAVVKYEKEENASRYEEGSCGHCGKAINAYDPFVERGLFFPALLKTVFVRLHMDCASNREYLESNNRSVESTIPFPW